MKTDIKPDINDQAGELVDEAYAAFLQRFDGIFIDGPITSAIWHAGASAGIRLSDQLAKIRREAV
jgi:hypothetical protein